MKSVSKVIKSNLRKDLLSYQEDGDVPKRFNHSQDEFKIFM